MLAVKRLLFREFKLPTTNQTPLLSPRAGPSVPPVPGLCMAALETVPFSI